METKQITKERLNLFVMGGKAYVNANIGKQSLLTATIETILPYAEKELKKVERQRELTRINLCKKTASKHIESDKQGRYQFTEESNKELLDKFDVIDEEMVTIPFNIVPEGKFPEKALSYDLRKIFAGIVIPEKEYNLEDEELTKILEEKNKVIEAEEDNEQE